MYVDCMVMGLNKILWYNTVMAEYEEIMYEGKPAKYYPQSGAIMQANEQGKIVFKANTGGNPLMKDPEYCRAMQRRRWESQWEAIAEGLIKAGFDINVEGQGTPEAVLTEIVRQRAVKATEGNRDGNEAAKFIFALLRREQERVEGKTENSIKFELTEKQMGDVLGKIFKDE